MAKKKTIKRTPLVSDSKYEGKYVAFGVQGKKVIASSKNPGSVIKRARDLGVESPAIVFVPERNVICVY